MLFSKGWALLLLGLCIATAGLAANEELNGRWVIEPLGNNNGRVLWLEINGAGTGKITGSMVGGGPGGQLDTILNARLERKQLHFHLEQRSSRDPSQMYKTPVVAVVRDGKLFGSSERESGTLLWVGERAPVLAEHDDGSWKEGSSQLLFDGSNRNQWQTLRKVRNDDWYVENTILKNRAQADVLVSRESFWNFRLFIEYLVHPGMNAGIGLRGRYEVQILDDFGQPASDHGNGALYGRIKPAVNASRKPGEWQSLEITLIGRELTVILNGTRTIDHRIVEGFTAMATNWREDTPGPITLQGDHGTIEFRKIVLTPLVQ